MFIKAINYLRAFGQQIVTVFVISGFRAFTHKKTKEKVGNRVRNLKPA